MALRYAALLLLVGLTVGPFLWLLSTSLKGAGENIYAFPPSLLPQQPTLANYLKVFESQPFFTYLLISSWNGTIMVANSKPNTRRRPRNSMRASGYAASDASTRLLATASAATRQLLSR